VRTVLSPVWNNNLSRQTTHIPYREDEYRLEAEYGAGSRIEKAPWTIARWLVDEVADETTLKLPHGTLFVKDKHGKGVLLFEREWHMKYFCENNKDIALTDTLTD
jgi:peptide subunit release factor RF-3